MRSYSADIEKWAKKAGLELEDAIKGVILRLFSAIIKKTPVVTGRLQGNWMLSVGDPDFKTVIVGYPSGEQKVIELQSLLISLDLSKDEQVFMTNSLPYAYKIEYEAQPHYKAPDGMVNVNFLRITQMLKV